MTVAAQSAVAPVRPGLLGALSDYFWRHPKIFVFLMLLPPLLWLGIVYVGSLIALLVQSFFAIDEFSGMVDRSTLTLKTYGELLRPQNLDIIIRTVLMAAAVTIASAVMVEVQGEGVSYSAPATRRIYEYYVGTDLARETGG